ncbi:hypothetical protein D1007_43363 [Hordeum vulgare]|nr:hypothetical protein D1007_43363 [Hordeum vulgare]
MADRREQLLARTGALVEEEEQVVMEEPIDRDRFEGRDIEGEEQVVPEELLTAVDRKGAARSSCVRRRRERFLRCHPPTTSSLPTTMYCA